MKLRIAGAQVPVVEDVAANLAALGRALDFAAAERADVLLTPEGSLSGYTHEFDKDTVARGLEEITARAREAGVALALGTCFEETDGKRYNELRFYERDGTYLGFHAKTLRCGSLDEPPRGEVANFADAPLRVFHVSGVPVGGLICNDMWANPCCTPMPDAHLAQRLARLGARVVLHAVNGGRDESALSGVIWHYHESNLLLRARAARLWIATADNCHPAELRCSAPSGVVSPEGEWVAHAPEQGEGFYVHEVEVG